MRCPKCNRSIRAEGSCFCGWSASAAEWAKQHKCPDCRSALAPGATHCRCGWKEQKSEGPRSIPAGFTDFEWREVGWLGGVRLPFGKYQGSVLGHIPLSYLDQTVGDMSGFFAEASRRYVWLCMKALPLYFEINGVPRETMVELLQKIPAPQRENAL